MIARSLRSSGTLTRTAAFRAVYAKGRWTHGPLLSLGALLSAGPSTQVGLRTRRNLKGAVVRNRLKRQLRPILQAQRSSWRSGLDIVIVIHPKSLPVKTPALQQELSQLAKRAGIVQ